MRAGDVGLSSSSKMLHWFQDLGGGGLQRGSAVACGPDGADEVRRRLCGTCARGVDRWVRRRRACRVRKKGMAG